MKKNRVKYNNGGLQLSKSFDNIGTLSGTLTKNQYSANIQTPKKHHSFGIKGNIDGGISNLSGSTGTAKNRIKANVGVDKRNKGIFSLTASRNTKAGEVSATLKRQPKANPTSYGKETFVGVQFTRRF